MKILVIRFSSIGDMVMTTAALRCLKQQVKNCELHFLTRAKFKTVIEHNPYIDQFFYYQNQLVELKKNLRKHRYDYVVDLHCNLRSLFLKRGLGARVLNVNKENWARFLLIHFHINQMSGKHNAVKCIEALSPLGVVNDQEGLDYFTAPEDELILNELPPAHSRGFIVCVIGASYYTKKLPTASWITLCAKHTIPIVLLGGKEDSDAAHQIRATSPSNIWNACGIGLNQSAVLIRQSNIVITTDTGFQHIACAFKKPVITIWGGTTPLLGVGQYYGKHRPLLVETNRIVPNLKCQPCSKYGSKTCPRKHFNCMKQQDVEKLHQHITTILGG